MLKNFHKINLAAHQPEPSALAHCGSLNRGVSKINLNQKNCISKELNLCHKFCFCNHYIFATQCQRPQIFQTWNYKLCEVKLYFSLKYQRFTSSGCKDKGINFNLTFLEISKIQMKIFYSFLFEQFLHNWDRTEE